VGRAAGTGDDGFEAPACGGLGVAEHVVGHAVGGNDARLKADTKLLENLDCVLHGVPIRVGTHDDADLN